MGASVLFIGLGNMGLPMAIRLLQGGHSVQGFDVFDTAKETFCNAGGIWLEDLNDIDADIVFAMLPGGVEMKRLYLEEQKLFSLLPKETLIVDCSTADPQDAVDIHKEAKAQGLRFLSAPVSGGVVGAGAGTLTIMVGGETNDLDTAKPFLQLMGKNIFHAGEAGDGQSVKICNNMLLAIHMIGTCEAFALGDALGLDPKVLSDIMQASSGNNWSLETYNPYPGLLPSAPSSRDYEGGFSVRLMLKDLELARRSMERSGCETTLGSKAHEIYKRHFDDGFAGKDFSHILTRMNRMVSEDK